MKKYTKNIMGVSVTVEDATDEVLEALEKACERGLDAIGLSAEKHAKEIITNAKAVVTGRLKNSVAFATSTHAGETVLYDSKAKKEKKMLVKTKQKDVVYIGTNVDYAKNIELGLRRKAGAVHFLKKASTDYNQEYKDLMKDSLENV